jgi:hypothetical protein
VCVYIYIYATWQEADDELLRIAAYICMMPARLIPPTRLAHVLDVRQVRILIAVLVEKVKY